MTSKEYFERCRHATRAIRAIQCEREQLYRVAGYGTGVKEATRISGTSGRSRVEDAVCAIADLDADLEQQQRAYMDCAREAERVIAQLPSEDHRAVLRLRYIASMSWEQVAGEMCCEVRTAHRIHGYALLAAKKIIDDR